MANPVILPVNWFEQLPGLCGAATAQMILNSKGLVGTLEADQQTLWTRIQTNTAGIRPAGEILGQDCPEFANQICERCDRKDPFTCWCTHPAALEATLNGYLNPGVILTTHADHRAATARALESIDAQLPAAMLVYGWLHWLTVVGYTPGDDDPDSEAIGGRQITDVYVHDPRQGGTANQRIVAFDWLFGYLTIPIPCGALAARYAVIAAAPLREQAVQPAQPSGPVGETSTREQPGRT